MSKKLRADQVREAGVKYESRPLIKYKVVIEKTKIGYSVHCPELKGCWSQGNTKEEALSNIKDAIITYLDSLDEVLKKKEVYELEVVR